MKEVADKEFEEFVQLLKSARGMPQHAKPLKFSWGVKENVWNKIQALQAYAIDACKNDDQMTASKVILSGWTLLRFDFSASNRL